MHDKVTNWMAIVLIAVPMFEMPKTVQSKSAPRVHKLVANENTIQNCVYNSAGKWQSLVVGGQDAVGQFYSYVLWSTVGNMARRS